MLVTITDWIWMVDHAFFERWLFIPSYLITHIARVFLTITDHSSRLAVCSVNSDIQSGDCMLMLILHHDQIDYPGILLQMLGTEIERVLGIPNI